MSDPSADESTLRARHDDFRWEGVRVLNYKEEGTAPFRAISRQTLFSDPRLQGELRYFEIAPGGFSTLERHEHMHAVMIFRGEGHCLVGDTVHRVKLHDLITIAPLTWHQFRATSGSELGFLCMVNAARDRPQLPSAHDIERLRSDPAVARFLDGGQTDD
ncbi:MAG: cupin domain-containing protein [Rhizomicrobium sp.]